MASRHHHNHHNPIHSHYCGCCCYPCCSSDQSPPTPTTTTTTNDPLLQAIAAHLLQSPPPLTHHLYSQHHLKSQHPHQKRQQQHHQQLETQCLLIQSLLRRVAALETSLPHHLSSSPSPKPSPPRPQPSPPPPPPRLSIRDLAARTIQVRFRLYLVRRSQTLRHLKHLASVRSRLAVLKPSLSDRAHQDLSHRATDLLLQLESIQSIDPMIREGKRSISRELTRLLEFADGVSIKRQELSLKSREIAEKGVDRCPSVEGSSPGDAEAEGFSRVFEDDEEAYVGILKRHASVIKPLKRVSFAEKGKESRVSSATQKPFTGEEMDPHGISRHGRAFLQELRREAEEGIGYFSRNSEDDVDEHWEEGLHQVSDDEKSPRERQKAGIKYGMNGFSQGPNGSSHLMGVSAPLPVQMEPRRSDLKKKNVMGL